MRKRNTPPRKPLSDALFFINAAQEILMRLMHDVSYAGDDADFVLLQRISNQSNLNCMLATHVEFTLQQRQAGEWEPPPPAPLDRKN